MKLKDIDPFQLLSTLQQGIVVHAASTEILYANPKALEILRLSEQQALGKDAMDPGWHFIDAQLNPLAPESYPVNRVLAGKTALAPVEFGIRDSSTDAITWLLCNAYPQFAADGRVDKVVVGLLDISHQKNDIPFEAIVAEANDVILVTNASVKNESEPEIVYVNRAFCELTGYTQQEVLGKTPKILQGEGTSANVRKNIRSALVKRQAIRETILNYSKSGVPYWLDMNIFPLENALGQISYFAAVERDVTSQVDKEAELKDLARKDPLTGLLNRRGFFEQVKEKFAATKAPAEVSVAMIDIDYFKRINDDYGHDTGDRALTLLAGLLRKSFRESDLICRYGGEEFVVLLAGATPATAHQKLETVRATIAHSQLPLADNEPLNFTVSIGIAAMKADAKAIENGLKNADLALYQAKKSGRNKTITQP